VTPPIPRPALHPWPTLHPWPATEAEAEALQTALLAQCHLAPLAPLTADTLIAGCDLAYDLDEGACHAVVVVARDHGATVVEQVGISLPVRFPYVPGLLSFREVPALLAAFEQLRTRPDVILCDGQGIAHPRGLGLASHLGLWLNCPTVGCAKSWLIGDYPPPPPGPGSSPLSIEGRVVGAVVRRIAGVNPVFVSPGHLADVAGAAALVRACAGPYRVPEPLRTADLLTRTRRGAVARLDPGQPLG